MFASSKLDDVRLTRDQLIAFPPFDDIANMRLNEAPRRIDVTNINRMIQTLNHAGYLIIPLESLTEFLVNTRCSLVQDVTQLLAKANVRTEESPYGKKLNSTFVTLMLAAYLGKSFTSIRRTVGNRPYVYPFVHRDDFLPVAEPVTGAGV